MLAAPNYEAGALALLVALLSVVVLIASRSRGASTRESLRLKREADRRGRKMGDYFEDDDTMLPLR